MRRIPELDALRGIAAVVIVVFHVRFLEGAPVMGTAVDLFFILSGYLITSIILGQGRTPGFFGVFYARRALRIWPIYYLALVACLALNRLLPAPDPLRGFWQHLAYLQNVPSYWHGEVPTFSRLFLHSWTLAIEEQFYLLWPLYVVLTGQRGLRIGYIALAFAPIWLRAEGYPRNLLLTRSDGLAMGALLADLFLDPARVDRHRSAYRRVFVAVGLAALVARQVVGPLMERLDGPVAGVWTLRAFALGSAEMTWIYFALVGLVLLDRGSPCLALLRRPRLVRLGTISYGIYLYHPFVLAFVPMIHKRLGIKGSPWMDAGKILICIALAEVSWRLVEGPILRLKDRFSYARPAGEPALKGMHAGPAGRPARAGGTDERGRAGGP